MARSVATSATAASQADAAGSQDEAADAARPPPASYEHALAELDRLVAQMEGGQLPLDELLGGYRRGNALLGYCRQRLQAVEDQVKLLEDGQLTVWTDA